MAKVTVFKVGSTPKQLGLTEADMNVFLNEDYPRIFDYSSSITKKDLFVMFSEQITKVDDFMAKLNSQLRLFESEFKNNRAAFPSNPGLVNQMNTLFISLAQDSSNAADYVKRVLRVVPAVKLGFSGFFQKGFYPHRFYLILAKELELIEALTIVFNNTKLSNYSNNKAMIDSTLLTLDGCLDIEKLLFNHLIRNQKQ